MTAGRQRLESRYRRWLALYPRSFRAEHEEEMLAVLMQSADPGQTRPRLAEVMDLTMHGLRRRVSSGRLPSQWERDHAKVMFPVRIVIAIWLCFLSVMLVVFHRAEFLLLLIPAILLHLYIAYRIRPSAIRR